MQLAELAKNTKLILEIPINNQHLEFESFVAAKTDNYILLEAIRVDGKVINFENGNVLVNLLWMVSETAPLIWKRVLLKSFIYAGKTFYLAVPSQEGYEINRRSAYRMYTGVDGVAQVGINKMAWDVTVKNVSETGFSFVCKEKFEKAINTNVRLVYFDFQKNFNLTGHIVRTEDIDQDRYIYGCALNIKSQILNQYIMEKQREMILKQRDRFSNNKIPSAQLEHSKVTGKRSNH